MKDILNSKLLKDSAFYTALNLIERSIPFLLLPILTRYLTKSEVGYYVIYQAFIEILIPVMTLNIGSSILINYYKVNASNFSTYFSSSMLLFFPIYIISISLIYVFSDNISHLIGFPKEWLIIVCLIVLARFFTLTRQYLWRAKYDIRNYGIYTIGISIFKNGIGLILVLFTSLGWQGLILGHLIGYGLFAYWAILTFIKEKLFVDSFDLTYIKDAFHIGYPLALHKFGLWLGNAANRIIIAGILGSAATGNYGIGATFAILVTIVEDAFTKAFTPHLFDRLKNIDDQDKSEIVKLSYFVYIILTFIAGSFYIIGYYFVGIIFGHEYLATRDFILPLIIAALFTGFYKLHVNYIIFSKKTLKITQITLTTGVLNIALAYIMTLQFGLIGTAYSLLIVNSIQYILTFYVSNKLIPMPWVKSLNL